MKAITNSELKKIETSSKPERSIHVFTFNNYKEFGYDKTQDWIRQTLKNEEVNKIPAVKNYLRNRVDKNEQFEPYKDELLNLTLRLEYERLESWVYNLKKKDLSKQSLFEILLELFVYIQYDPKTENNDTYYDFIADFLDRFTYLGKAFRIFPDEPDCK